MEELTGYNRAELWGNAFFPERKPTITQLRDRMGTDLKGTDLIGLGKCAEELVRY